MIAFCSSQVVTASNFEPVYRPDTIRVSLSKGLMIEISYANVQKNKASQWQLQNKVNDFISMWEVLKHDTLDTNKTILIRIDHSESGKKLSITEIQPHQVIIYPRTNNEILIIPRKYILETEGWDMQARIYCSDLKALKQLETFDIKEIFSHIERKIESEKTNKAISQWYKLDHLNTPIQVFHEFNPAKPMDSIMLSCGTSLNNIKSNWLGSFHVGLGLSFGKKMVRNQTYTFSYEWLYNFSSPTTKEINHFIDLSYSRNLSNNPSKNDWYGISVGYLVKREGNVFEKNTFRIGISTHINNKIVVSPEIYFHNFFKAVYPGLKIGVHF